jgi:hypothetical protein
MLLRALLLWAICTLSGCLVVAACLANDLDDGIEIDDSIEQYSTIGNQADLNFSYLAQRSRSRAAAGVDGIVRTRDGVLNSVILEPGSQLHGDIIIIDQSRGDKTIIAE